MELLKFIAPDEMEVPNSDAPDVYTLVLGTLELEVLEL